MSLAPGRLPLLGGTLGQPAHPPVPSESRVISAWTLLVELGAPGPGQRCGLEIDPRRRRLLLAPFMVGEGSEEVGRLVVFRALFQGPIEPAMAAVLRGPRAEAHLQAVESGYCASLLWSGDLMGSWSEAAWAAAVALVEETLAAAPPVDS